MSHENNLGSLLGKIAAQLGSASPLSSEIPHPSGSPAGNLTAPHIFTPTTAAPGSPAPTPRPAPQPRPQTATQPAPQPVQPSPQPSPGGQPEGGGFDWMSMLQQFGPHILTALATHIGRMGGMPGLLMAQNWLGGRQGQEYQTIFGGAQGQGNTGVSLGTQAAAPRPNAPTSAATPTTPTPATPTPAPATPTPTPETPTQPTPTPTPTPDAGETPVTPWVRAPGGASMNPGVTPSYASPFPWMAQAGRGIANEFHNVARELANAEAEQPRSWWQNWGTPLTNFGVSSGIQTAVNRYAPAVVQRVAGPTAGRAVLRAMGGPQGYVGQNVATDLIDRSSWADPLRGSWFGNNVLGLRQEGPLTAQHLGSSFDDTTKSMQDDHAIVSDPNQSLGNRFWASTRNFGRHAMRGLEGSARPVTTAEWTADSVGGLEDAANRSTQVNQQVAAHPSQRGQVMSTVPDNLSPYIFETDQHGQVSTRPRSPGSFLNNFFQRAATEGPLAGPAEAASQGYLNLRDYLQRRQIAREQGGGVDFLGHPVQTPRAGEGFARDVTNLPIAGPSAYWNGTTQLPGTNTQLPALNPSTWGGELNHLGSYLPSAGQVGSAAGSQLRHLGSYLPWR